jgi:hypothetical protein
MKTPILKRPPCPACEKRRAALAAYAKKVSEKLNLKGKRKNAL